jgi:hypothetical protein
MRSLLPLQGSEHGLIEGGGGGRGVRMQRPNREGGLRTSALRLCATDSRSTSRWSWLPLEHVGSAEFMEGGGGRKRR